MIFDKAFFIKFLKFGAVGFSGVFVDFSATWLLKEKAHLNAYLANSVGFLLAVCWNFWLNRVWTFSSADPNVGLQFAKFFAASLIGLGLNNAIIWFLTERLGLNFWFAKLAATGVVVVWNFFANVFFTFR